MVTITYNSRNRVTAKELAETAKLGYTYINGFLTKVTRTDSAASKTQTLQTTYDPYGNIVASSGSLANVNPLRYRGYYYDKETGFYYLNSRYYDPAIGRFINADDTTNLGADGSILSYNLFAYCFNNPVNLQDTEGQWPDWATKLIIGTAVIAVAAILTVATAGTGTMLACFAVGALQGAVTGAAVGAASGAVTGAVVHRLTTGSWEGAGQAALNGAADGYMSGAITGFITGGLANSTCFVAGTAILTSAGYEAIESIQVGDLVWTTDPETSETTLKEVVRTFVNEATELVHIMVNGEEIVCTNEHPFYSPVTGWIAACNLSAGDTLTLVDGTYTFVEQVQSEVLIDPILVYNFEVEDFHTYYVAKSGVLVHNVCVVRENGVRVDVRTSNEHGLPHAHVSGNGQNTTVGLNQQPMPNHPALTPKQQRVIQKCWELIENGINEYFPKLH